MLNLFESRRGGLPLQTNLGAALGLAVKSIVCALSDCQFAMGTFALLNTLRVFSAVIKRTGARLICVTFASFALCVEIVLVLYILTAPAFGRDTQAVQGSAATRERTLNSAFANSL